jgi:hypothetical protein
VFCVWGRVVVVWLVAGLVVCASAGLGCLVVGCARSLVLGWCVSYLVFILYITYSVSIHLV